ncbi:hypothetical protein NP233_g3986 [Leucocoprinus birnbaumii]|uniref:Uncharacterized protein n=1 Tax=Leucocoprinus birnbaumii TaxID=56174 RepID=A0AAD5VVK2_9AGAR|nr:hypothetical protein NP233_g3986 [Leucocoprinus birnbaumii]
MPVSPGSLQQLWKALNGFFLWLFLCVSPTNPRRESDIEARIDLPTNIIYGEKLPTWMTEPPKGSKIAENDQPLRHSDEWAQQKEVFLRWPGLRRKNEADVRDRKGRASRHRVRFSDFPVEYPRTPSNNSSQDLNPPPVIRIEDWSTPPSPGASPISSFESLAMITASNPQTGLTSSSSRDSLTVPSPDSPGFRGSRSTKNRKTVVIDAGQTSRQSRSDHGLEQNWRRSNVARRSSLTRPFELPQRNSKSDASTPPRFSRPVRSSKSPLFSSTLDLLQDIPILENDLGSAPPSRAGDKQDNAIPQNISRGSLTDPKFRMTGRISQQPQRKSSRLRFIPKRHHSQPLATKKSTSLWNGPGATPPLPSKMGDDGLVEGQDYYRHSIDVVGLPFPMAITLSSDVQTAILTRFHEKGLAATPEKSASGFRRQLPRPSGMVPQSSSTSGANEVYVPYPDVLDLDDYFRDPSPAPATTTPTSVNSASEASTSTNESHDPYDTPTPAPGRTSSSTNLFASARGSDLTRTHRTPVLVVAGAIDECPMHKTATPVRKPCTSSWSSDTDEDEQSISRSEYSDDSDTPHAQYNSAGNLPLTRFIHQRAGDQSKRDKRRGIYVTRGTGAIPGQPPPRNDSIQLAKTTARKNGQFEMEQIRKSLRSHYIFTQEEHDPFDEVKVEDDDEDSLVSLVESYNSGSTLSHHHHTHQWRARSHSSPLYERKQLLDPVIEVSSDSEGSSGMRTPKATPSPRFNGDDSGIMTVDRTPTTPSWVLPPQRSGGTVDLVSLRLGLAQRSRFKDESGDGIQAAYQADLSMQRKAMSAGVLTSQPTKTRVTDVRYLPSVPPQPAARRVVPQKF